MVCCYYEDTAQKKQGGIMVRKTIGDNNHKRPQAVRLDKSDGKLDGAAILYAGLKRL
jgi:hypothetical protein